MSKPIYKNALRSKRMIREAFFELIQKKDISQIKIKEIIELADISKGTFYAHYQDIYAVYEDIENENIHNIVEYLNEFSSDLVKTDFLPFIDKIFDYVEQNKTSYIKLFSSSVTFQFMDKLQGVFVSCMMSNKKLVSGFESEIVAKQFFGFIAVGTACLMRNYFLNENAQPLEEVKRNLNQCILYGLNGIKS
ncbi:MAG: TetR/AcrR family transcriptional regulator [Eubacteriales bacterium]